MMYGIAKLARRIANDLEIKKVTDVWDILDELNYQTQELNEKQVNQWSFRVSKKLFYSK